MLLKATALIAGRLKASDGDAGFVVDLFFDDQCWRVCHLVVALGARLAPERMVLLSAPPEPRVDAGGKSLQVGLTREQIEACPDARTAKTVSRRHEIAHALSVIQPSHWRSPLVRGTGIHPGIAPLARRALPAGDAGVLERAVRFEERQAAKSHLRSMREVMGYQALASDGQAGVIDDFVVDAGNWAVAALVVDARKWWPGGRVTVPPDAVEAIDWAARAVRFDLASESLKSGSPA